MSHISHWSRNLLVALLALVLLAGCSGLVASDGRASSLQPTPRLSTTALSGQTARATSVLRATRPPNRAPTAPAQAARPPPTPLVRGMDVIAPAALPREARRTLDVIAQGGPFPYRKDGTVFQNRERLLPRKPSGYYREYTVPTPGENDRGARRIIAGENGELFYTDDHYNSFVQVIAP